MSDHRFRAECPQSFKDGDKFRIKGVVTQCAKQFSINFTNDSKNENITYHFKWVIIDDGSDKTTVIIENWKQNGSWMDEQDKEFDSLDGPSFLQPYSSDNLENTNTNKDNDFECNDVEAGSNDSNLILGNAFALEFLLLEDSIYVYLIHDDGHNFISNYNINNPLSDITAVEVWGDVAKVTELAYLYN